MYKVKYLAHSFTVINEASSETPMSVITKPVSVLPCHSWKINTHKGMMCVIAVSLCTATPRAKHHRLLLGLEQRAAATSTRLPACPAPFLSSLTVRSDMFKLHF